MRDEPPGAQDDGRVEQIGDASRIVRRQQDDRAAVAQVGEARQQRLRRRLVQAGERLVEQDDARLGDQRTFQADALPHAAGEPADRVVGAIAQAGAIECRRDARPGIGDAVQRGEEAQVLGRGELGIEPGIVSQPADVAAHGR